MAVGVPNGLGSELNVARESGEGCGREAEVQFVGLDRIASRRLCGIGVQLNLIRQLNLISQLNLIRQIRRISCSQRRLKRVGLSLNHVWGRGSDR